MATLSKVPPSSLRNDSQMASHAGEHRPYLVPAAIRRTDSSSGVQTLVSTHTSALFEHESEDARLTGSTRSLYRRLLALNLPTRSAEAGDLKPAAVEKASFPSRTATA